MSKALQALLLLPELTRDGCTLFRRVIIETAYLTWEEVAISTLIASLAGAAFVKTSTGECVALPFGSGHSATRTKSFCPLHTTQATHLPAHSQNTSN